MGVQGRSRFAEILNLHLPGRKKDKKKNKSMLQNLLKVNGGGGRTLD